MNVGVVNYNQPQTQQQEREKILLFVCQICEWTLLSKLLN